MHRVNRIVLLTALVVVFAVAGSTAANAASRSFTCHRAKQFVKTTRGWWWNAAGHRVRRVLNLETVAESNSIWIARDAGGGAPDYFACWKPGRRAHYLGADSGGAATTDRALQQFTLEEAYEPYVAYRIGTSGDDGDYDRYRSINAKTGQVVRDSARIQRLGGPAVAVSVPQAGRDAGANEQGQYRLAGGQSGSARC